MKTLYLLRHAKSSWAEEGAEDLDRPLAPRGRRAAPAMGDYMQARQYRPDLVLCSPARRARETLALLEQRLGRETATRFEPPLYLAPAEALLRFLRSVEDEAKAVLVIGHNPGLERLALLLAGSGEAAALKRLRRKFPTAALAVLAFDIQQWQDLAESTGELRDFMTPPKQ